MDCDSSPRTASRLNRILVKTRGLRHIRVAKKDTGGGLSRTRDCFELSDENSPTNSSSVGSGGGSPTSWCRESGLVSMESTRAGDSRPVYSSSSEDEQTPQSATSHRDSHLLDDLFRLLHSQDPAVREKALATIFHLVQASPATRDTILEAGGVQPILNEIQRDGPADAQTARALFHLCMGDPQPPFHLIAKTLPSLQRLLVASEEEEVLIIVAFVLNELTTVDNPHSLNYIIKILPPPLHARLIALLTHHSVDVRFRSLQLLAKTTAADRLHGAVASGSQCEELLKLKLLVPLRKCLAVPELQNECLEIIQNLLPHHLDTLLKSEDLIRKYFALVKTRLGFDAKVVAMLKSSIRNADNNHMMFLHECGCNEVLDQTCKDLKRMQQDMDELLIYLAAKNGELVSKNSGSAKSAALTTTNLSGSGGGGDAENIKQ
eukprot:Gregarina_sp_Pseudo_9__5347@NODE_637_length_2441_cov_23_247710_g601_i0_p1_GENE_NODE_637_length_2441_cov_23_247710_g601_i0NODE_637_length_2441_cov_23_247710_g601_i0_p1_ORF_typecomplete_len434_score99_07Arm_2/PF04826_13/6_5e09Arm_2/PF04826_13/1_4e03KAP/PF05804_12/9_6e05KAP/PF05804_12/2_3e02RTTN_N/PF14726_6/0_27RTTN_N/PF14726_6/3e02RTTN_N/PF14726_6/5e02RTTN_N/PF14726_6/30IFRD/PF05004_13/0_034IFRD/PF05004_13/31IFRD/PF05004_13/1_1e03DUF5578/PF17741_1/0_0051DUF5578/PF17741_1/6e02DUF5578/PF17741_1/1_1e